MAPQGAWACTVSRAQSKYHPAHTPVSLLHERPVGTLTGWGTAQFFQMGAFLLSENRMFEMLNTNSGGLLSGEGIQELL